MLHLVLSGIVVSIVTEILRKKKKKDKVRTLWTLLVMSVAVSLLTYVILDYVFWTSLVWILVFAGAFYAYFLRNIRGSIPTKKVVKVVKRVYKKKNK